MTRIPYGATTTYGVIAAEFGNRNLAQRVGQSVGHNPVSILALPSGRRVGRLPHGVCRWARSQSEPSWRWVATGRRRRPSVLTTCVLTARGDRRGVRADVLVRRPGRDAGAGARRCRAGGRRARRSWSVKTMLGVGNGCVPSRLGTSTTSGAPTPSDDDGVAQAGRLTHDSAREGRGDGARSVSCIGSTRRAPGRLGGRITARDLTEALDLQCLHRLRGQPTNARAVEGPGQRSCRGDGQRGRRLGAGRGRAGARGGTDGVVPTDGLPDEVRVVGPLRPGSGPVGERSSGR